MDLCENCDSRHKEEDSEYCTECKPKPSDSILPDEDSVRKKKYRVTYYHELEETITVEAETEDLAKEKADEKKSYEGEITHTPHEEVREQGATVKKSDEIREENKKKWQEFQS